jgi:methylenetetrahydrofolate dehydrogenase (NADP+)/methenyltetrahydrofolate cyclohydrolase
VHFLHLFYGAATEQGEIMILDGKVVAADIKQRLKEEIDDAVANGRRRPYLVIVSVGDDPASKIYIKNKMKAADEVGIDVFHFPMAVLDDGSPTTEYVQGIVANLNEDDSIDGIMVQLPLPSHLDERAIIDTIDPAKDVDGLTTTNIGRLRSGQPCLKPCTAAGIIDLCKYYGIELDGKDVTIVGRSNIVGKPQAMLLLHEDATVTVCHSKTQNLAEITKTADILVVAIGKADFVTGDMVKAGAAVIDVAMNRKADGKLTGDVDFESVFPVAGAITPVPGGVGPMTITMLLKNTVTAAKQKK